MATCDLRWILSTQARSSLKMRGFEPSIDLDLENCFFEQGSQLNNYFWGIFLPSSMWPRDAIKMKGFEPSIDLDFENVFLKNVVNLTTTFWELFCPHRGGHGTL